MPLIKASCPTCGDVELTLADIKVMVCSTDGQASYNFRCPSCRYRVSKPAEKAVVDILLSSGVTMSFWRMPMELEEDHQGEPISYDELMDFHCQISNDGWLDRLIEKGSTKEE
ncbi:hypothetical protein [Acidithrix ferrooxidans]|uniref:Uncharacterized protein n=1 Tax=Acidithrix ferrooxidans TaxID=1280514 RepID=A0A0D8HK63_9ACTN|nr:hypothetical protein [Acidithrix ferrooxidans]KJF18147.1 hypothetical protein AXFE_10480 [Acidithrix ferrooxidans]